MARKPRVHFPAALYHVMLRGNGGQDIFFEDTDRYRFYLLLQEKLGTVPILFLVFPSFPMILGSIIGF